MQPEDFKPVAVSTLSDKTDALHYAVRHLESRQRKYNETVEWAQTVLSTPEGRLQSDLLLRHLNARNDEMLTAQFAANSAHSAYMLHSMPTEVEEGD
jgi:hypothetical protein